MNKLSCMKAVTAFAMAALMAVGPSAAEAQSLKAKTNTELRSDDPMASARINLTNAFNDGIGCLAWDSVWEDAGSALGSWAMFGTNNFCGDPVELNRSDIATIRSPYSLPADWECRNAVGNPGQRDDFVRHISVTKMRKSRRGQEAYVLCTVNYVILD